MEENIKIITLVVLLAAYLIVLICWERGRNVMLTAGGALTVVMLLLTHEWQIFLFSYIVGFVLGPGMCYCTKKRNFERMYDMFQSFFEIAAAFAVSLALLFMGIAVLFPELEFDLFG